MTLKFDDKLNELAESTANEERIKNIEKCFGNDDQTLYQPGRVLVGEGILNKMCRKKPKIRYFFLFNDILVYGTSVIYKKKYIGKHIIPLKNLQIKPIPDGDDPKLRNGWLIMSPVKSFSVYATTAKEKEEWITHITNCIQKLNEGRTSKNNLAPQWIPDKEADTCMRCNKTKFNVVNRRHHCRKCGFVICGDCSKKKYLLKLQSNEPVRVCDKCFETLSNSTTIDETNAITDTSGESDGGEETTDYRNVKPKFY